MKLKLLRYRIVFTPLGDLIFGFKDLKKTTKQYKEKIVYKFTLYYLNNFICTKWQFFFYYIF
ncbi:hypothetical protein DSECCO2_428900 [anaerobic digester metagenome]|jgi:hypothetical protein